MALYATHLWGVFPLVLQSFPHVLPDLIQLVLDRIQLVTNLDLQAQLRTIACIQPAKEKGEMKDDIFLREYEKQC